MTQWNRKRAALAAAAVVVVGIVLVWLLVRPERDESLERVLETGLLRVAIEGDNPPFGLLLDDEMRGLDVDLARALAEALGVEVQFAIMGYDSLYDALEVGLVDAVISALWVDPDRMDDVRYARAYFNAGQVMVVAEGGQVRSADDLEGRTLAVEFGSEGDVWARREERRRAALRVVRHDTPFAALDALARGEVDAAVVHAISARTYLKGAMMDLVVTAQVTDEPYAVAVRSKGEALWRALDKALGAMIDSGALEAIVARWF